MTLKPGHNPCEHCGSSDALYLYPDGGQNCWSCGFNSKQHQAPSDLIAGKVKEIKARGLSEATCGFFNYQVGRSIPPGQIAIQPCHIATYYKNDKIVGQKLRFETGEDGKKRMDCKGTVAKNMLFGANKWAPNPNLFITIVEGEIDCMTVAQANELRYPVVSPATGGSAKGVKDCLEANLKYLLGFKYVVLALDNDEVGIEATKACVELFEPGKIKIATWPLKDANEMLMAGRGREIQNIVLFAKTYTPENIVTASDIIDEVLMQPQTGQPYPWKSWTDNMYGFQPCEITILVGANGIGKTEIVKDLIHHFIPSFNIGLFSFEQIPSNTLRRLVGSKLGTKLHLPGAVWEPEKIRQIAMEYDEKLFLIRNCASLSDLELCNYIRYLAKAKNIKYFIIDNLKGLGSRDIEKMEGIIKRFQAMKLELGISFLLLSHVAKDKYSRQVYVSTSPKNPNYFNQDAEEVGKNINKPGLDWESGRMPTKENIEGASVVADLADTVICIARNTISEDEAEKRTLRCRFSKTRFDGMKGGFECKLYYTDSGYYEELGGSNDHF